VNSPGIHNLHQGLVGLYGPVTIIGARNPDCLRIKTCVAQLGNITRGDLGLSSTIGEENTGAPLTASGSGFNDEEAKFLALMEGLERYSACIFEKDQLVWATGNELAESAIDLERIPRCSAVELSHAKCPLRAPDKSKPIRWVRALSLFDGALVYVPAVMVYLDTYQTEAEQFWLPISTGCAAHTSYERALLNGISEVVERDAISITWLQKLPLPRIEVNFVSEVLHTYWDIYQKSSRDVECFFFDATTDLGIPTIYGLQISPGDRRVTTTVSCSAALDPSSAIAKVICEMAAIRVSFRTDRPVPSSFDNYCRIFDGATFMARAEQSHAFDFLLKTERIRPIAEIPSLDTPSDASTLRRILEIFRRKGLDVYAVDLTTDEALRAGLRVVRVLIPGLLPFSWHYRARYLGHSRLYEAPKNMGYRVLCEQEVNAFPQPFA
jgi:ribosomal protein S12 methylthiotransferase accessory factor